MDGNRPIAVARMHLLPVLTLQAQLLRATAMLCTGPLTLAFTPFPDLAPTYPSFFPTTPQQLYYQLHNSYKKAVEFTH